MNMPDSDEKRVETFDGRRFAAFTHSFSDPWADTEIELSYRFAKPSTTQIKRLNATAPRNPTQASKDLLIGTIHPDDKESFLARLEEYPGITTSFSNALLKAVGISSDLGN